MRLLFVCAGLLVVLSLVGYALYSRLHLSVADSLAIVGLIGIVATVIAVMPKEWLRTGKCLISHPYLTLGGQEKITFRFEANVMNAASDPDVLEQVRYAFYHRQSGDFPVDLYFGAREIHSEKGQIVPCPLQPGHTYQVVASDVFRADDPRGKRLRSEGKHAEDYTLRCEFLFHSARRAKIRIYPHRLNQPKRFSAWVQEHRLRVRWQRGP